MFPGRGFRYSALPGDVDNQAGPQTPPSSTVQQHDSCNFDLASDSTCKMMDKGRLRAYWLGSVVCMGGFLFGYDSGM